MKKFVFILHDRVHEVNAVSVTKEAEVLFVGDINSTLPENIQTIIDQQKILITKEASIKDAYTSMVKDIYDEMLVVFGTNNDVSAQAFAATYEAMAQRPANYVGSLGLVDEAAVLAYANSKIAEADAYAIFRLNRIAQFQAEKAAIINS